MKKSTLFSLSMVVMLITAVLISACQPTPTPSPEPSNPGGAGTTSGGTTPTDTPAPVESSGTGMDNAISKSILLDPALATDADSQKINQYLYSGLIMLDASGNPQPAIAASWVTSDDQLDYIFQLNPEAAFSDGSAITADTIIDNFNRWFDPESPLRGTGNYETWKSVFEGFHGEKGADGRPLSPVDGVEKVDTYTVIVHLNRQVPELLTYIANPAFSIVNPEALGAGYGTLSSTIVSSGPYKVASWTDSGLTLTPNDQYWGAAANGDMEFTWK